MSFGCAMEEMTYYLRDNSNLSKVVSPRKYLKNLTAQMQLYLHYIKLVYNQAFVLP